VLVEDSKIFSANIKKPETGENFRAVSACLVSFGLRLHLCFFPSIKTLVEGMNCQHKKQISFKAVEANKKCNCQKLN